MRGDAVGSRTLAVLAVLLSIALGGTRAALADEGVLEINHTCAAASGCFPGDTGGYPVSISAPGSYRLASNLSGGITLSAGRVSIDLNGFLITPGANSIGVGDFAAQRVSVHDGRIAGPCTTGVALGDYARVERIEVSGCQFGIRVGSFSHVRGVNASLNTSRGITAEGASVIADSIANGNGSSGIDLSLGSGTVQACTVTSNGGSGGVFSSFVTYSGSYFAGNFGGDVAGGHAGAGNYCHDKTCTTDGRKRFYLSSQQFQGSGVACSNRFHVASLFELHDPSSLHYSGPNGIVIANTDGGAGPPSHIGGWVRTGHTPSVADQPGKANCNHWQSSAPGDFGSTATLSSDWLSASRTDTPWVTLGYWCSNALPVWCIED